MANPSVSQFTTYASVVQKQKADVLRLFITMETCFVQVCGF